MIAAIRQLTGLGLAEVNALVNNLPAIVPLPTGADVQFALDEILNAGGAAELAPVPTDPELLLTGVGSNRVGVIAVVRQLTGLGLAETVALVDSAPVVVSLPDGVDLAMALNDILAAGGAAEIRPGGLDEIDVGFDLGRIDLPGSNIGTTLGAQWQLALVSAVTLESGEQLELSIDDVADGTGTVQKLRDEELIVSAIGVPEPASLLLSGILGTLVMGLSGCGRAAKRSNRCWYRSA